jgi:hypothetical protein
MEPAARPQRDVGRKATLERHIFQGKADADLFHETAVKGQREGNNALAEVAFDAEKACRETIAALEKELKERY